MKAKLSLTALILFGSLLFSGCNLLPSPKEVIKAPQQAITQENEYQQLIKYIQEQLPTGAKLIAPANPVGAKAIQKGDLDGDGQDEIVATYSIGADPGQLKVAVFKEKEIWSSDGTGYILDWFSIQDITGDKKPELLLGWTVGASAGNELEIFTWDDNSLKKLTVMGYHKLEIEDMPGANGTDEKAEIALWQRDIGDSYNIEVMRWQDNGFVPAEDVYPHYFKKAVEFYNLKVKEIPDAAIYWYYLADSQVKANLAEEALQSINTGVALNADYPGQFDWDMVKGEALNKLGKHQEAIKELQKAVASLEKAYEREAVSKAYLQMAMSKAYLQMARSYIAVKDYDQGRIAISKSMEITTSIYQDTDELQAKLLPAKQLLNQLK